MIIYDEKLLFLIYDLFVIYYFIILFTVHYKNYIRARNKIYKRRRFIFVSHFYVNFC